MPNTQWNDDEVGVEGLSLKQGPLRHRARGGTTISQAGPVARRSFRSRVASAQSRASASSSRISSEIDVTVEVEPECRGHFCERPVRKTDGFKTTKHAFAQPSLHEKWRGPQHDHVQREAFMSVSVPQAFHGFRPILNFLDFVENEYETFFGLTGIFSGSLPLVSKPSRIFHAQDGTGIFLIVRWYKLSWFWRVDREISAGEDELFQGLPHERGFAGLPRAGDDDQPFGVLAQSAQNRRYLLTLEAVHCTIGTSCR